MQLTRHFNLEEEKYGNIKLVTYLAGDEDYGDQRKELFYRDHRDHTLEHGCEAGVCSTLNRPAGKEHLVFLDAIAEPDRSDLIKLMDDYVYGTRAEILKTKRGYHVYTDGTIGSVEYLAQCLLRLENVRYWLDLKWLSFCLQREFLVLRVTENTDKGKITPYKVIEGNNFSVLKYE